VASIRFLEEKLKIKPKRAFSAKHHFARAARCTFYSSPSMRRFDSKARDASDKSALALPMKKKRVALY